MFRKLWLSLLLGLMLTGRVLAQTSDYYLPYPGILPDHPLYWLKMVRDRISLIVTSNKTAKAEKMLLYADKRLGAAWALIDGNKIPLGVTTITKAEKYLEQAWIQGKGTPLEEKISKAIKKHLEVLQIVKEKTGSYSNLIEAMIVKLEQVQVHLPPSGAAVTQISLDATTATTAFGVLEQAAGKNNWDLVTKDYDFGKMVQSIAGTANNPESVWIFYVNGETGDRAADKYELKSGDKVEWKYEAVKP